jgi:hypothetical protein
MQDMFDISVLGNKDLLQTFPVPGTVLPCQVDDLQELLFLPFPQGLPGQDGLAGMFYLEGNPGFELINGHEG